MKKHLTQLLLLVCLTEAYGQNTSEENQDSLQFKITESASITFNVFTPFMGNTPRYRFGYIQPISGRWMAGIDVGYGAEGIVIDFGSDGLEDYQLYELRGELYYLLDVRRKGDHYLSFETHYLNHTQTFFNDAIEYQDDRRKELYERTDYERDRIAFTIKYGTFYYFSEQFGINIYYGMGLRIRNNTFSNTVSYPPSDFPDISNEDGDSGFFVDDDEAFDFGANNYTRIEGRAYGLNISLGIKLFYRL
ncbi:MAG: hypothetical protein HKN48_09435 [Flavobacteriaceae bacterium]|nr:hypothetical protein [Flavobacteriaceae bacterium]